MRIRGQQWHITGKYLILPLNEFWWSAYQRFGWPEGTAGCSISEEALQKAINLKKKILIKNKYGDYEITTTKAQKYLHCRFTARDNTELICLPRFALKKLPDEPIKDDTPIIPFDARVKLADLWAEVRKQKGI